jgi:hypothetical protein
MSNQNPGSRYTDGSLDLHHVSLQMDGSDRSQDFYHENSQPPVIVTPDFTNDEIPIFGHVKCRRALYYHHMSL